MIAPTAIEKISAILPRLASDHDGEVVATARAVSRVLASAKSDWHDVVAAFERGAKALEPPKEQPRRQPASPPEWIDLTASERERWLLAIVEFVRVSAWERSFARSVLAQHRRVEMSERQIVILDRLLAKAFADGVRL